jgi:Na+-driven multidrug efflux pump
MAKSATKDMTEGSPSRLMLGFFFPMLFGMLFQQFYNMMDTIIVGKYLAKIYLEVKHRPLYLVAEDNLKDDLREKGEE